MSQWCDVCGVHEYNFMNCDNCFCPLLHVRLAIELGGPVKSAGPNDVFEISGNNSPDLPDDDDEVHEPQDYTGDYGLEGDDGEC
jgi:hypothetical protein